MQLLGRLLTLVAVVLVLANCGGDSDASPSNYVDVSAQSTGPDPSSAAPGADTDAVAATSVGESTGTDSSASGNTASAGATEQLETLDATEFDEVAATFEQFLWLRANAMLGDIAISDLAGLATNQVMAQVSDLNEINTNLLDTENVSAVRDVTEWPNITDIQKVGDRYNFIDCTERQQVNLNYRTEVFFVTNAVEMVIEDGVYKVDRIEELQNGRYGLVAGEYGCVPPSFIERAETVANTALTEVARAISDPAAAVSSDLPDVFADSARTDLQRALEFLIDQNLRRDSDEEVSLQVVGMDVNDHDYTVIVSVCRYYPNGRSYVNTTTGEAELPDIPKGGSQEEWISVHLEPVASGTETADVAVSVEAQEAMNCWRG